ncbi:MAG TPA: mevalonate kinase [Candidatus Diapherotrites archaeon]|uniref:Mevalonate kinase n=1 Tax=Candidatus Iainarchaeum sp. TaxID=3101447 RepID=A0A7J4IZS5_9ARCH|nr:mevalonate kinase [Candidatus Diapherotrites archaeon]
MGAAGVGWGKAILFGEHFVVYGLPGIAASIELNTTCTFEKNKSGIASNDLVTGEVIRYGDDKGKRLNQVLEIIFNETGIREGNFRLAMSTNMSVKGGMGSSAALAVSITRCLDREFGLGISDEKVNDIAFKVEKLFHSNPSGIDNTVSTFGGLLWFVKGGMGNKMERIGVKRPVEAVLIDSGIIRDTGEAVDFVKGQREKEPEKFSGMFEEYNGIALDARKAIEEGDWKGVGVLMNRNQELLREMEVSSKEIEEIITACLNAGAFGAKLTGAGLGGNAIALTPGRNLQEKVAKECKKAGFETYKILIGVQG